MLFTFIIEYAGGTYIRQYRGTNVREALEEASKNDDILFGIDDFSTVAINDTLNVFGFRGGIKSKKEHLTTIIATNEGHVDLGDVAFKF